MDQLLGTLKTYEMRTTKGKNTLREEANRKIKHDQEYPSSRLDDEAKFFR